MRNGQRYRFYRRNLRGYVLADLAVTAGCRALEVAVLIGKAQRKPVEFVLERVRHVRRDFLYLLIPLAQFVVTVALVQTIQFFKVAMRRKLLDRVAADLSRGRVRQYRTRRLFQREQFVIKRVVLHVRNGRLIQNIILIRILIQ